MVELVSSSKVRKIQMEIDIPSKVTLLEKLIVSDEFGILKDTKYNKEKNEYYIDKEISYDSKIIFDTKRIRSDNRNYKLDSVEWDI
jgi:hypothetical protein